MASSTRSTRAKAGSVSARPTSRGGAPRQATPSKPAKSSPRPRTKKAAAKRGKPAAQAATRAARPASTKRSAAKAPKAALPAAPGRASARAGKPKAASRQPSSRARPALSAVATTETRAAVGSFFELATFVKQQVDAGLADVLDQDRQRAQAHGPDVALMHEALSDLCLRGGKRLRAALVAVGYRAAKPQADLKPALQAGVALELLQAYFLVHDDWMDRDDTRRGGPSVHRILSEALNDERLGAASGILAGDYLAALAMHLLAATDVPGEQLKRALASFAQMQLHAVMGQQLDLLARAPSVEHTYALKTGSYSVAGPLELGARLAGGGSALEKLLIAFGLPLGIAFQLRDDLMSVFGEPAETGKPRGSDLLAGKRTALVVGALDRLRGAKRKELERIWGNRQATPDELARATELCESSGAKAAVEQRIAELIGKSRDILAQSRVSGATRTLLEGAAQALTERSN